MRSGLVWLILWECLEDVDVLDGIYIHLGYHWDSNWLIYLSHLSMDPPSRNPSYSGHHDGVEHSDDTWMPASSDTVMLVLDTSTDKPHLILPGDI